VAIRICCAAACLLAPVRAGADHQHGMAATSDEGPASSFAVGVSLIAARFDTLTYGGDYEGIVPSAGWAHGRFAAAATIGMYRLQENGRRLYGLGDAVVHGHATIVARPAWAVGAALAVSAPTGDHLAGLGMGHPMVMPAAWARWTVGPVTLHGSAGYGRPLGAAASHHAHGAWPLVDPMNTSELMWMASGDVPLSHVLRVGARLSGGVPVGAAGANRVIGGAQVLWAAGQVDTAFELQAGITGDPFTIRGVVETALRF
jgi:hypothetical protein